MSAGKVTTMREAIAALVRDGDRLSAACGLEARIPFAAGHEIIRQRKRDLTLIGPISDMLYDQLIGAGCARAVEAAWVGSVGTGIGYNYRRAAEEQIPCALAVTDYTNLTVALGIRAAAEGVPFAVTRSIVGTDFFAQSAVFAEIADPFSGEHLVAVKAIPVDIAIVHAQRADAAGNAHLWGNLGTTLESARAAKRCIVSVEEMVAPDVIRSDPNRTLPGFLVDAVVVEPLGAHPAPVAGYYDRDHGFFEAYASATRKHDGWQAWRREWIDDIPDRLAYRARLGAELIERLRAAA